MHFSKITTLSILLLLSTAINKAVDFKGYFNTAYQSTLNTGTAAYTHSRNAVKTDANVFIKEIAKQVVAEHIPTVKIKGIDALNANDVVEVGVDVAATLHEELNNGNKDVKNLGVKVLKKASKTYVREKTLTQLVAATNYISKKTGVALPETIEQNAKAKYVTKAFLTNFARNIIDTVLGSTSIFNSDAK